MNDKQQALTNDEQQALLAGLGQCLLNWPDALLGLDNSGQICWASDAAVALLGWPSEKLMGCDFHEHLCVKTGRFDHARDQCPIIRDVARTTFGSGFWLDYSGEYLSIDYCLLPVPGSGDIHTLVSFFDNRNHPYSFVEFRKFAGFVDKNPAAVAEFDEDGQLLFGNPSLQELLLKFGFSDTGHANIFPLDIVDICDAVVNKNRSVTQVEVNLADHWFIWHFHPLIAGGMGSVIGYALDATEQKNAEEQAKMTRAEARRDFYAKMMHELRTPLNAIVGYSDLVMCRSAQNLQDRDQRALRGIKAAGMQLNELISDTLDISKIEAGKMTAEVETFDVTEVVKDIHEQMHYLAEAKRLEYRVSCDSIVMATDRRKIRQILVNLVSNAIKYTRKGHVQVEVTDVGQDTPGQFQVLVTDTGVGIPEEQINGLFQAYEQVREKKNIGIQGTGLGLALVHELVEILGGRIWVESRYGEGSQFYVHLPRTLQVD